MLRSHLGLRRGAAPRYLIRCCADWQRMWCFSEQVFRPPHWPQDRRIMASESEM